MKPKHAAFAILSAGFLALGILFISACANQTPAQKAAIATDLTAVNNLVQDYASDGQLNYADVIPVALDSLAIYSPSASVQTAALAPAIASAVNAFTNGTGKTTGQKIAAAVTTGLPAVITGLQANQLLSSAGVQASNGAQAVASSAPTTSGSSAGIDPTN